MSGDMSVSSCLCVKGVWRGTSKLARSDPSGITEETSIIIGIKEEALMMQDLCCVSVA